MNERYERQEMLPEIGKEGQQKLRNARITVVGAGGLGCPVLLYLTAVGVGHITIIDDDAVSLHNLQRQILYTEEDIYKPKAEVAAGRLSALNNEVEVHPVCERLCEANASRLIGRVDLIIDCTDNLPARKVIDACAARIGVPWLYGSIGGWQGQCSLMNCGSEPKRYADLLLDEAPLMPAPAVLGALSGMVGAMQVAEAVKYLAGLSEEQLLTGKLWWMDLKTLRSGIFRF
ncbi:Sulfur carrier protein ThiS adenylyltransferase [Porphyromonas macacae]|uniref:Sulfur carrier protein ThiS adenylyltransferase n=1 Tax=Porphyromonas macacae TaxID=28115 RepID=A0A379DFI9_9PORP|nr:HesA/MoeB/ThiF family protein [Porphyromonas macacae]SUB76932.1 Sulfur carrier protein ThiS adenylyltransferase [Porphyromonas macacae]